MLSGLTTVFDVTGLSALNILAGLVDDKLPVGVQLVGRPFDEGDLFLAWHTSMKNIMELVKPWF